MPRRSAMPLMLLLLLFLVERPLQPRAFDAGVDADVEGASALARSLVDTLDAIDSAIAFMNRYVERANLDGVIGLRIVEGQFTALLARYWTLLPSSISWRLKDLQEKAGVVSGLAIERVQRRTPKYFKNAGNMLRQHCWDTFYPTRRLRRTIGEKKFGNDDDGKEEDVDFGEKFSDDCIGEFSGKPKCKISDLCWRKIVQPKHLSDYSLTHQVFYLLNGVQANCLPNLTAAAASKSGQSVTDLLDDMCVRVAEEAEGLAEAGFPSSERDLLMEQIGLCGIAGYSDLARFRWLSAILSWQRPNGCFGSFADETLDPRNFELGRYGSLRRRKRAESAMSDDGCLSHRTSVALCALIAYVRRQVEQLLQL